MVGHISCRTGIPGIKNIADHIRLILAGNKENKILRSKQKAAGHGYAFLPIIGIDTHLIRMKGRKQIFLPRKDRGGMPVVSSTEQNDIEGREATPKRNRAANQRRIVLCFNLRAVHSIFALYLYYNQSCEKKQVFFMAIPHKDRASDA